MHIIVHFKKSCKLSFDALQDLSYKDRHWHEQCFKCAKCSRSLADKAFAARDDLLLCTECYAHDYSSKCITCKKTILPGNDTLQKQKKKKQL